MLSEITAITEGRTKKSVEDASRLQVESAYLDEGPADNDGQDGVVAQGPLQDKVKDWSEHGVLCNSL